MAKKGFSVESVETVLGEMDKQGQVVHSEDFQKCLSCHARNPVFDIHESGKVVQRCQECNAMAPIEIMLSK